MKLCLLLISYISAVCALFLYSFTQVDLSLTLTRASIVTDIQRGFQYIGYFNRSLSAFLFAALVILLFVTYWLLIKRIQQKNLSVSTIQNLVLLTAGILVFSYTAFSYDIFNYIFDAKIVTFYNENPYEHKALDYPGDPMLSFMRWTHRVYPYGPVWLGVSIPLSYLGMNFFLPTYFLFKILAAGAYIGSAFFIGKIMKIVRPNVATLAVAFFAFNPLVIIEYLVTGHNDSVMLFFMIFSLYLLVRNKKVLSIFFWLFSAGIKFSTAILLPLYIYMFGFKKNNESFEKAWFVGLFFMSIALIAATLRSNFQPWYLLYIIPFAALLSYKKYIIAPVMILSFISLCNYVPFLYTGNWDPPIPQTLLFLNISGLLISVVLGLTLFFRTRIK